MKITETKTNKIYEIPDDLFHRYKKHVGAVDDNDAFEELVEIIKAESINSSEELETAIKRELEVNRNNAPTVADMERWFNSNE